MPSRSDVVDRCTGDDLTLLRLVYVGNDGLPRGYVANADDAERLFADGMNLTEAMQSFTSFDQLVPTGPFGPAGSVRLVPDPETFRELPFADRTALMLCDLRTPDGEPWAADPRSALRSLLDARPYEPSTAFESEFYLLEPTDDGGYEPVDRSVCFSANAMQSTNTLLLELVDVLEAQGMEFVTYYPEYGPGQQELVIAHDRGLRSPDNYVRFRHTVHSIAHDRGLAATFLPKPFADASGSGCHLHLSLWDGDENVFYDGAAADASYPISETARQFAAGVLDHLEGLLALTAPTALSYDRLQPGSWSSAYACWGTDNREATVRVPFAGREAPDRSTRLEYKPADSTANPYLALLGLLAAGFDGIDRELDPGDPVDGDPAALDDADRASRGIRRYPETLDEALDALEGDDVLRSAMGDLLHEAYLAVKRHHLASAEEMDAVDVIERQRFAF